MFTWSTLKWIQPLILLFVGVTNVKSAGFSPVTLAIGCNWDLSTSRPQSGFMHWKAQVPSVLVVGPHGRTEAHVGQRNGKLLLYGHMLLFHQTYLLHVMVTEGAEERSKEKWKISVCAPNSGSCSRAHGKLAEKSIDCMNFDWNNVRRKRLARGAWKCGVTKAIQSWIGILEKRSTFNERVEKRTRPTELELSEDLWMNPQTWGPNCRSGEQGFHHWGMARFHCTVFV